MSTTELPRSRRQHQDQRRASSAWHAVSAVPDRVRGEYRTLVLRLPAMLLANGLGQTLAFVSSKRGEMSHGTLYRQLEAWLNSEIQREGDLLSWIVEADLPTYRLAHREALAYVEWLKRFVEATKPNVANGQGR